LRELEAATEKPVSTAEVTLDDRKFDVKTSKRDRTVVVSDKATTATMTATVNGIEDGGLLKIMMQGARNGGVLATKFIEMAQEKANRIKTLVDNATPQIMEVVSEGVNRDREGKIAAQKAVERIGADLDGLIGTVQTTIATSPALAGTVGKMKRIERVEAGEERQVEAIVDAPPSIEQSQIETPEQIGLQERLNAEVAQNYQPQADTKANARSQQAQSSL
jgi:hypothetical protein